MTNLSSTELTVLYLIVDELQLKDTPSVDDYLYDGICIDSVDFEAVVCRIEDKFHVCLDYDHSQLKTMTIREIVNHIELLTKNN